MCCGYFFLRRPRQRLLTLLLREQHLAQLLDRRFLRRSEHEFPERRCFLLKIVNLSAFALGWLVEALDVVQDEVFGAYGLCLRFQRQPLLLIRGDTYIARLLFFRRQLLLWIELCLQIEWLIIFLCLFYIFGVLGIRKTVLPPPI